MKKNKKNLSIFKRIGLIAIALFSALGSLFVPFKKSNQSQIAGAYSYSDTSFISSDLLYGRVGINYSEPITRFGQTNDYYQYMKLEFKIDVFNHTSNTLGINFSMNGVLNTDVSIFNDWYLLTTHYYNISSSNFVPDYFTSTPVQLSSGYFSLIGTFIDYLYVDDEGNKIPSFRPYSNKNVAPSGNIKSIEIGDKFQMDVMGYDITDEGSELTRYINSYWDTYFTYICFTDTSNFRYWFIIPYYRSLNDSGRLDYRVYYTSAFLGLNNNDMYEAGYLVGLQDSQPTIYKNGYNAGYTAGKSDGFNLGVSENNPYTFKSLFGAVIDVPIKAFSGLFNFEFLGVNLLDFFFGLLTFSVIIFVVKLVFGGK